jgi:hypothetical protein
MNTDRRLMPRYDVALPIIAGGLRGTTRNVGVTGVSFVAPAALRIEESIAFSIVLSPEPNALTINCTGVVKRATRMKDGQFEIVATIDALDLDTAPRM